MAKDEEHRKRDVCHNNHFLKVILNIARSEQSSHTPVVAIRGCNTFRENLKSVVWPQNEHCIDALFFDEKFHIHYIGERKKMYKTKGLIRIHSWYFNTQYNLSYLIVVQKFKILGQVVTEKSLSKTSIITNTLERETEREREREREREKKKNEKKAKIILTTLVLFTAIHLIVLSMYTHLKTLALNDAELIQWKKYWKGRKMKFPYVLYMCDRRKT